MVYPETISNLGRDSYFVKSLHRLEKFNSNVNFTIVAGKCATSPSSYRCRQGRIQCKYIDQWGTCPGITKGGGQSLALGYCIDCVEYSRKFGWKRRKDREKISNVKKRDFEIYGDVEMEKRLGYSVDGNRLCSENPYVPFSIPCLIGGHCKTFLQCSEMIVKNYNRKQPIKCCRLFLRNDICSVDNRPCQVPFPTTCKTNDAAPLRYRQICYSE